MDELFEAVAMENFGWIKANFSPSWLNAVDGEGSTVLCRAIGGSENFLNSLLSLGFDPNVPDRVHQLPPLYFAVIGEHCLTVEVLLKHGAAISVTDTGDSELHYAAQNGLNEIVELLACNCDLTDLNRHDNLGMTPLMYAVANGFQLVVKTLVLAGSDVNSTKQSTGGETALHLAAQYQQDDIYHYLVEVGGSEEIMDVFGISPKTRMKRGPFLN